MKLFKKKEPQLIKLKGTSYVVLYAQTNIFVSGCIV